MAFVSSWFMLEVDERTLRWLLHVIGFVLRLGMFLILVFATEKLSDQSILGRRTGAPKYPETRGKIVRYVLHR